MCFLLNRFFPQTGNFPIPIGEAEMGIENMIWLLFKRIGKIKILFTKKLPLCLQKNSFILFRTKALTIQNCKPGGNFRNKNLFVDLKIPYLTIPNKASFSYSASVYPRL